MSQRYRLAGLLGSLVALVLAIVLLGKFFSQGSVSARVSIPAAEIQPAAGFRHTWHVPPGLRAAPWYRASVRIWEDGKPLPFRVENRQSVETEGMGRFGVAPFSVGVEQREYVSLSASDNTRPATNGRKYELETQRPVYRLALLAAAALAAAVLMGLAALPKSFWTTTVQGILYPGQRRATLIRYLAVVLAFCAALLFSQLWPPARIIGHINMAPGALIHESGSEFRYRLPRWVRNDGMAQYCRLYENSNLLKRTSDWGAQSDGAKGSFCASAGAIGIVRFRASDGSNPALNGRRYRVTVPLLPPTFASLSVGALLALGSLLLFFFGADLSKSWVGGMVAAVAHLEGLLSGRRWRYALLGGGILKLWVVAGAEVLAFAPDAYGYAQTVVDGVWGNRPMPFQPLGFSFLTALVKQWGVPWRLALELLYLLACAGMAGATASLLRSRLAALALFLALAWHPWTFLQFNYFLSEPVVLLCSIALAGAMMWVLQERSSLWHWRRFLAIGCVLFLWEWCRSETLLVYATYGLFAAVVLALARRDLRGGPWRQTAVLALPLLVVLAGGIGVKVVNYAHYGVFTKSARTAPGLCALMETLARIKPDKEVRFAPVTRQSLEAAMEVSPTLARYRTRLLQTGSLTAQAGANGTEAPKEWGAQLILHLYDTIWARLGADREKVMRQSASEIAAALRDGRLPGRRAHYPLDPLWKQWVPELPASFLKHLAIAMSMKSGRDYYGYPQPSCTFDAAASRRTISANPRILRAEGVLLGPLATCDSVALMDDRGSLLGAALVATNSLHFPGVFDIQAKDLNGRGAYGLAFFREGRLAYSENAHGLNWWTTNRESFRIVPSGEERNAIECTCRVYQVKSPQVARFDRWQERISAKYSGTLWIALLCTMGLCVFGQTLEKPRLKAVFGCFVLVLGWLLGRATFYALVDVNLIQEPERFMGCAAPLSVVLFFLSAAFAGGLLQRLIRGGIPTQAAVPD
ncbi:MAG TPA: hypothetical protein PKI20_09515 [Verrucomicrobiota bacterium]|mgnify:CR=1 FL=1|nr:hypothetical protein [Verrucomicrobiota bacterium]HQL78601.1 hypothetical protein [Verrucomicrobiota bacterium]